MQQVQLLKLDPDSTGKQPRLYFGFFHTAVDRAHQIRSCANSRRDALDRVLTDKFHPDTIIERQAA